MSAVEVLTPARQAGAPGYSAYQLAVQAGYTGTQAQWLASLVGPPADTAALNAATAAAQGSATSASGSATAAFGSMQAATASATAANSSAAAAAASVNAAATQAANAGTSATAAGNSAGASAASATASDASAILAQNWAMKMSGTVDGTNYSSRYWANQAQLSAQAAALSASQAAGAGITPSGSFAVGDFLVAGDTAGKTATSGGAPAAVAKSGSASDLGTGTLPAARLPTNGVTNGNLAQMPTLTLKGNLTGGTANAADVAPTAVLDTFGSTQGSILIRGPNASGWAALGPGTAGQVLQSGGAGANPAWATPASIYPVTGTAAKSAAYTLGSTAGDTGKVFVLTGSFALTLPLASGGSAASPLWYHVSKRDGSGACTITLSGSDTWEDGTTAAEYVYQESCTLYAIGDGKWRFAPNGRQRGWVDAGVFTVSSGTAAVSISLGFNDPRIRDVQVDGTNYKPSTSGALYATVTQGGSAQNSTQVTPSSAANAIFLVDVKNIKATTAYGVPIFTRGCAADGSSVNIGGTSSTTGSVTALVLTPSAGTVTSLTYNVKLMRP